MSASATFNWAYRPGITNKYGFTVPTGADNSRPSGWCYVALFGNDSTGNGSRQYPYRTITKAITINTDLIIVLGSGVYREASVLNTRMFFYTFIGDGDVIIDISYNKYLFSDNVIPISLYNLQIRGDGTSVISELAGFINDSADVFFNGSWIDNVLNDYTRIKNCVVSGYSGILSIGAPGIGSVVTNCTFVNCNNLQLDHNTNPTITPLTSCIFYNCNISAVLVSDLGVIRYSLFFQCNFKLTNGVGSGGVLYPSVPSGYSYYSTIGALRDAYFALFDVSGFTGCTINNPLFNNPAIGDYGLAFGSPAKNLSYFGTNVGARSISQSIKVSATESTGGFEFGSAVNLTIADDSLTLTNPLLDAQIDTKPIVNLLGREIASLPSYGFNADRNGQYIDSIADLSASVYNPGDTLPAAIPFLVEDGAIVYNGITYQAGERGVTVASATTFSTATTGVIREITEAPQRHTVMARFTDGGSTITAGAALTAGYYYFVVSGSATYGSNTYNAGGIFKAVDSNAFSGSGIVMLAFSTESFEHYEPGIRPTSNNIGDARTGVIVRGNGDPAYIRGGIGMQEFPINAKFIQIRYIIRVSNLKP